MIDLQVLEAYGSNKGRLKEVFTADTTKIIESKRGESKEEKQARLANNRQVTRDIQVRKTFENKWMGRIDEGITQSLRQWRIYAAVDLAFDSSPITKVTLPLMQYAQGRIDTERCAQMLEGTKNGANYVKRTKDGKVESIDLPTFVETNINLVRSIILRRWSAQKNIFNELWPYDSYEPRSTGLVAKLRADVLSQRMDIMADQFGHREHDAQVALDGFLYAYSVDFARTAWEVEKQWERAKWSDNPRDVEEKIVKEGLGFFNPHPSRVFWDNAYPLVSLNSDTGCKFIGFWDVVRYSEIDDNPDYFNKRVVGWTGKFWGDGGIVTAARDYFTNYGYTILPPWTGEFDLSRVNDRVSNISFYQPNQRDASVFKTEYFEKFVPKDYGIGDYPYEVWARFVVASDNTCIYAEFYPSTPGAVLKINTRDSRQVSPSMAMDIMPFQDALTNLVTHLLLVCKAELFKVFGVNTDVVDSKDVQRIIEILKGESWSSAPLVVPFSLAKLRDAGVATQAGITPLTVSETKQSQTINTIFEAIIKLVSLCERLLALSPAEQGQPAPREITATEVTEISATTSSIYSSISDDWNEFKAAKKRIKYESLVSCSEGDVVCPVKDRYPTAVILKAGFKPKDDEDEDHEGDVKRRTVYGSARFLVHDYIFTSRDGTERRVNTQAANTLVQLVSQVLSVPAITQAMGKAKLYEIFNEIFRLSGAGIDLNLSVKPGEDDSLGQDEMGQIKQTLDQLIQHVTQMAGQTQKNAQDSATQEQQITAINDHLKALNTLAQQVKTTAEHVDELHQDRNAITKRLSEQISYKDCPPSIQAQMESQAGFVPAPASERAKALTNGKTKTTTTQK